MTASELTRPQPLTLIPFPPRPSQDIYLTYLRSTLTSGGILQRQVWLLQ